MQVAGAGFAGFGYYGLQGMAGDTVIFVAGQGLDTCWAARAGPTPAARTSPS